MCLNYTTRAYRLIGKPVTNFKKWPFSVFNFLQWNRCVATSAIVPDKPYKEINVLIITSNITGSRNVCITCYIQHNNTHCCILVAYWLAFPDYTSVCSVTSRGCMILWNTFQVLPCRGLVDCRIILWNNRIGSHGTLKHVIRLGKNFF